MKIGGHLIWQSDKERTFKLVKRVAVMWNMHGVLESEQVFRGHHVHKSVRYGPRLLEKNFLGFR